MATAKEKEDIFIQRLRASNPRLWERYCELVSHESMSKDELAAYNFSKRKEIVRWAYDNTKFYHDLYSSVDVTPDDIKTEEDWTRLPMVTKQMLKDHLDEMCAGGGAHEVFKKYAFKTASGGSTGKPVSFYVDKREYAHLAPLDRYRTMGWWCNREKGKILGLEPILGQNIASIERFNYVKQFKNPKIRALAAQQMAPTEWVTMDLYDMNDETLSAFNDKANEVGIFSMSAYTGVLEDIARKYISGELVRKFTPRFLTLAATPLTAIGRKLIEEGFGCKVCDVYGSNEIPIVATECPCSNHSLHVSWDMRHLDIVDDNGRPVEPGVEGSVLVTDFTNFVMPFIRYALGDRTKFEKHDCTCGLPFPLIAPVKGRETDYLDTKDGGRLQGLCCTFDEHPGCALRYQFVQHAPGRVTLRVVPNKDSAGWDSEIRTVLGELEHTAAGRIDYSLEYVDDIPHDGGKIRFIVYE